jgi:lipopolysaccharide export LptBFGC system permease protein LptF
MKLIDRFITRELLANVLFAIAVLSLVLVVGNISVTGKNFPGRALPG